QGPQGGELLGVELLPAGGAEANAGRLVPRRFGRQDARRLHAVPAGDAAVSAGPGNPLFGRTLCRSLTKGGNAMKTATAMKSANGEAGISDFLAQKRIAVAGVSRSDRHHPTGNLIYRRLKGAGHQVFAVNPQMQTFESDRCYPDVKSIPGGVDGV